MEQIRKNKEFIVEYFNAISGVTKTRELVEKYVSDQGLVEHIEFLDGVFPKYELFVDEMTAEGNRVVVRARVKDRGVNCTKYKPNDSPSSTSTSSTSRFSNSNITNEGGMTIVVVYEYPVLPKQIALLVKSVGNILEKPVTN